MKYLNPIIVSDYSDPDMIRVGDDFYLIASSFNYFPAIPILHTKNLVDYEIINYALDSFLEDKYHKVMIGKGVWAPAIRYFKNKFYIFFPIIDEGIYVIESDDIYKPFSKPRLILKGKGYIDPCPLFYEDKIYLVFAFAKSRMGFNSQIALITFDQDFNLLDEDYKIIYDGHKTNPTIEGPKIYYLNGYFYISCPAGSVKTGWQVVLRSKKIEGPYEEKICLMQGDSDINGPHQGALVDIDENKYAFIHFQDYQSYGRIIHLQNVEWIDDYPVMGLVKDKLLPGIPLRENDYLIEKESDYKLEGSDLFKDKLNFLWQRPSVYQDFYKVDNGLYLYTKNDEENLLYSRNQLTQKVMYFNYSFEVDGELSFNTDQDIFGIGMYGDISYYLEFKKEIDKIYLRFIKEENNTKEYLYEEEYKKNTFKIKLIGKNKYGQEMDVSFYLNKRKIYREIKATKQLWTGGRISLFAKNPQNNSSSFALIKKVMHKEIKV